jgi:hypothetical protein
MTDQFDPSSVDLSTADLAQVVCYMTTGENDYNGQLGARISALFVILIVSSAATFFPVIAARVKWVRINIYVYLFARYFGAGVIIATAFIQYVLALSHLALIFSFPQTKPVYTQSTNHDPVSSTLRTARSVLKPVLV